MTLGHAGELRIGLTISGAIALGAYEGGALAALLVATQHANQQQPGALRLDAMAGASAGSMTAVLAARTLVAGLDPIEVMYRAWVTVPQLQALRDRWRSPLSMKRTQREVAKLLCSSSNPRRAQPTSVRINMVLGCLRGLDYEIGRIGGPPIEADTYLDWAEYEADATKPLGWYTAANGPMAAAQASGAHAVAFPPVLLDRSSPEVQKRYRENGIEHFPPSKQLWYTDGGTIDNEPLGRALGMTEELDDAGGSPLGDASRLHLLITPDPSPPIVGNDYWSLAEPKPTWTRTGLRTLKLLRVQRLYDDLRTVEKTNSRINWTRQLEQTLVDLLQRPRDDPAHALNEFAADIQAQKAVLKTTDDQRVTEAEPRSELARALRQALGAASGLAGKRDVSVAVISPLLLPEVASGEKTPRQVLAGEFLGHFGGFLNQQLRENDFAYGYRSMICWMQGPFGLTYHGLDAALATHAIAGAERARADWEQTAKRPWVQDLGSTSLSQRPFKEKLTVLRVAARTAAIVFRQILKQPPA